MQTVASRRNDSDGSDLTGLSVAEVVGILRLSFAAVHALLRDPTDLLPSYNAADGAPRIDRAAFAAWLHQRAWRGAGLHEVPSLTRWQRLVLAALAATGSTPGAAAVLGITAGTVRWHLQNIRGRYRTVGVTDVSLTALLEHCYRDHQIALRPHCAPR